MTPRVLVFLSRGRRRLFIEGAAGKWFAGRLNGLGGSVEPGEDALAAAAREVREECGLDAADLRLAGCVHVASEPAVLLFVFTGRLPKGTVRTGSEGRLVWLDRADVADPATPLLADVRPLLARIDALRRSGPAFFVRG